MYAKEMPRISDCLVGYFRDCLVLLAFDVIDDSIGRGLKSAVSVATGTFGGNLLRIGC